MSTKKSELVTFEVRIELSEEMGIDSVEVARDCLEEALRDYGMDNYTKVTLKKRDVNDAA